MSDQKAVENCPTCGGSVRIEGSTTQYYVPNPTPVAVPLDLEDRAKEYADANFFVERKPGKGFYGQDAFYADSTSALQNNATFRPSYIKGFIEGAKSERQAILEKVREARKAIEHYSHPDQVLGGSDYQMYATSSSRQAYDDDGVLARKALAILDSLLKEMK